MTTTTTTEPPATAQDQNLRFFPLSLAPIDWFFFRDDHPHYPMLFYVDLDFTGLLDAERLAIALQETLHRPPLLYAIVQPGRRGRPSWVLAPERMPRVDWASSDAPLYFEQGEAIDLAQEPGLRIWARTTEITTKLTFQFHHATCDGTGAYRFIGDLLGCYIRQLPASGEQVQLGEFDVKQLRLRPSRMRSLLAGAGFMKTMRCGIQEARKTFGARITPLRSPLAKPTYKVVPGMITRELSGAAQKRLRNVATELGVTLNDLLICKLFQAVACWNGSMRAGQRVRFLVPSDMRDGNDFQVPACNMTADTEAFLSVFCDQLEALLSDTAGAPSGAIADRRS